MILPQESLCGLVFTVPGYRPRGLGFDSRVWNGVHSVLVRINEELLERKVAAPV
jgi:hypothetical protein